MCSSDLSSNPPPCGSFSLYGVRHMVKPSPSAFCRQACKAVAAGFTACVDLGLQLVKIVRDFPVCYLHVVVAVFFSVCFDDLFCELVAEHAAHE